jgi:hypothetical protein
MSEDERKDLSNIESEIDLGLGEGDNDKVTELDAKVNIESLRTDLKNNISDSKFTMEYESKLSKLDTLQKLSYMNESNSFDKKVFSPRGVLFGVAIMYVGWVYFPDYIDKRYMLNPIRLQGLGAVGAEVMVKLVTLIKLASPIMSYILWKKYPLHQKSKYEIMIDYKYITGPRLITYSSMLERVRVKWEDIVDIKYDNKFEINHIRCLGKNGKDMLAIRLDVKSFDKMKQLVVEYTEIEHPLNKIFN